jgi:hypothetical protein
MYISKIYDLSFALQGLNILFVFIYAYPGHQHDLHFRRCSCPFAVTQRMPLVEQELPTLPEHMISLHLFV